MYVHSFPWNPFAIFDDIERSFWPTTAAPEWPVFDIEDDEEATTLTADLPGMTEDDLEITVTGNTLMVRGERKAKDGRYVRRGRWHGAFERQFQLADGYDLDDVAAQVANGVLTIRLAKTPKLKPRRIKLGGGVVDKVKGLLSGDKKAS